MLYEERLNRLLKNIVSNSVNNLFTVASEDGVAYPIIHHGLLRNEFVSKFGVDAGNVLYTDIEDIVDMESIFMEYYDDCREYREAVYH